MYAFDILRPLAISEKRSIWLFRDTLTKAKTIYEMFQFFNLQLEQQGIITHTGTIVDATFVDSDSKLFTNYSVTDAAVHDSQQFVDFIDESDRIVFADSAYSGQPIADALPQTDAQRRTTE